MVLELERLVMKKQLLGLSTLAVLVGGAAFVLRDRAEAFPPPPIGLVRVECNGTICGGGGAREFVYPVKVPAGQSVTSIRVGTHDNNLGDYTNLIMPAGWSLTIVGGNSTGSGFNFTPHGSVSPTGDTCPYDLVFSGPAQTANFTLAYDFTPNWDFHQAEWKASNGRKAGFSFPVGQGNGPVHSPLMP